MYIYGKNVAREKLHNKSKINKIYLSEKFSDKEILDLIRKNNIKVSFVKSYELDKKVDGLHQGIVMEIDDVKTYSYDEIIPNIKKDNPVIVMLDHLEDPHNFGAIIRTSEALGIDAIIIPNDRSVKVNATVIKTSVGAIEYIPIIKVVNLNDTIKKLKKDGYWIMATDMDGEDYNKVEYNMPICVIIGNEGKGISRMVRENSDMVLSIPMKGKINSLNASVSCAIILANIMRSRN